MLLCELLQPVQYKWIAGGGDDEATFAVNGIQYYVGFKYIPAKTAVEVDFMSSNPNGRRNAFDITGDQSASSVVFGTVIKVINDYVNKRRPDIVIFTAEEPSRIALYKRLIQRFAPNANVTTKPSLTGGQKFYVDLRQATPNGVPTNP